MFPADNELNRDVSRDPVDSRSAEYLAHMEAGHFKLHPDFGAPQYGVPFTVVGGSQARVPMRFAYTDSDPGPYPFPLDLFIQGGPRGTGDRHAIVFDRGECKLYETYATSRSGNGFAALSGAVFNLRSNQLRPEHWTSATASGLPIFPLMARYDEVAEQGVIRHALAFEATSTAHSYVHPATHSSGTSAASSAPPMGTRVRLSKGFNLSRYHGQSLVILTALKKFGMLLIDNQGAPFWALAGAQDPRWNGPDLEQLKTVPASAFEVIKLPQLHSGQ